MSAPSGETTASASDHSASSTGVGAALASAGTEKTSDLSEPLRRVPTRRRYAAAGTAKQCCCPSGRKLIKNEHHEVPYEMRSERSQQTVGRGSQYAPAQAGTQGREQEGR